MREITVEHNTSREDIAKRSPRKQQRGTETSTALHRPLMLLRVAVFLLRERRYLFCKVRHPEWILVEWLGRSLWIRGLVWCENWFFIYFFVAIPLNFVPISPSLKQSRRNSAKTVAPHLSAMRFPRDGLSEHLESSQVISVPPPTPFYMHVCMLSCVLIFPCQLFVCFCSLKCTM